jgi:hypothetical protein
MEATMKLLLNILGVLLVLLGVFFALEGANILSVVVFTHHIRYLIGGIVLIALGIGAFIFAGRRAKSAPPAP